jgi:Uncharacterized conserved protein
MSGSWCRDGSRNYGGEPVTDPLGPTEAPALRVIRGGSWYGYAGWVRSAYRFAYLPGGDASFLGFRLSLRSGE